MRAALLLALLAAHLATPLCAIALNAPACGGLRLVTHAAAKFGRPLRQRADAIAGYAPRPPAPSSATRRRWLRGWLRARRRRARRNDAAALDQLCTPLEQQDAKVASGRVVFALRGRCDFARKAYNAELANAVGVVIVNARHAGQLVNMKQNDTLVAVGRAPNVTIPAVMIRFNDWQRVAKCRDAVVVTLTLDGEAVYDIDYGRDALNWAMMRGMALWILCQCGVNVVRYKRRVSESRARATAVAALPEHAFGSVEADPLLDDEPICAVCLDGFEIGESVRRLPCNHLYHRKCIDPYVLATLPFRVTHTDDGACDRWLQSSSNACPICKREVCGLPPSQSLYGSISV